MQGRNVRQRAGHARGSCASTRVLQHRGSKSQPRRARKSKVLTSIHAAAQTWTHCFVRALREPTHQDQSKYQSLHLYLFIETYGTEPGSISADDLSNDLKFQVDFRRHTWAPTTAAWTSRSGSMERAKLLSSSHLLDVAT